MDLGRIEGKDGEFAEGHRFAVVLAGCDRHAEVVFARQRFGAQRWLDDERDRLPRAWHQCHGVLTEGDPARRYARDRKLHQVDHAAPVVDDGGREHGPARLHWRGGRDDGDTDGARRDFLEPGAPGPVRVGLAGVGRNERWRQVVHLDIAEADRLLGFDQVRGVGVDPVAADEGTGRRPQVLHHQAPRLDDEAGVAPGDAEVIDNDPVAIGAAHDKRGEVDGEFPRLPIGSRHLERTELHAVISPGAQGTGATAQRSIERRAGQRTRIYGVGVAVGVSGVGVAAGVGVFVGVGVGVGAVTTMLRGVPSVGHWLPP